MPNRIIKESVRTSDTLSQVSPEAERLFWRLVVSVDDYGRFDGRPNIIIGQCMSAFLGEVTTEQITAWLSELESVGLVQLYSAEGRPYLTLTKWNKHQRTRAKDSKFPAPDNTCGHPLSNDSNGGQTPTNVVSNVNEYEYVNEIENEIVNDNDNDNVNESASSGGGPTEQDVRIQRFYERTFGLCPNDVQVSRLSNWCEKGMEESLVLAAIVKARERGKSFGYILGILERQYDQGVRTIEQAEILDGKRQTAAGGVSIEYSIHTGQGPRIRGPNGRARSITGGKTGRV